MSCPMNWGTTLVPITRIGVDGQAVPSMIAIHPREAVAMDPPCPMEPS